MSRLNQLWLPSVKAEHGAPGAFAKFSVYQQDAIEWLRQINNESIDLSITDIAYESLEKHRAVGTTTRLKGSWFDIFPNSRMEELFVEFFRVQKKDSHLYFFCDSETMFIAKPIAESVGFKFWKPIVWDKRKIGMGYHYRARCEFILFFEKGKRKLKDLSIPDILEEPRIHKGYPTEKPVGLIETLVKQSSSVGELVIDPFMGSGSTGVAAVRTGRNFIGCDTSQQAFDLARHRLLDEAATEIT